MLRSAWEVADGLYGDVNRVTDIAPGVYAIDCAGHGGFLVDTETFALDPRIVADDRFRVHGPAGRNAAWRIFEEDVDWAVLLRFHPALQGAAVRVGIFGPDAPFEREIERALRAYHPDLAE